MDLRDYFISHNSADMAHAEAINTALRDAGYQTHFDGTDCPPGTNIPIWMNRALAGSRQVLALCSADYFKEGAAFSLMERMAALWGDPDGSKARLVPVQIADCEFEPLIAPLARISIKGMTPDAAAAALVGVLAEGAEAKRREAMRTAEAVPEVFHVPRGRNTEFSGHFEALGKIHQTLSRGENAAVTQAIAGLGGVGKTTLAAEYAHRFGTKGKYGGVWWVAAESESGIVEGLAELARKLGKPEQQNLPAMAREARDFVQTATPPWLVIFDNAPDADAVREWLPAGSARVLITSRATDFTGLAEVTRLDEWDLNTTAEYLLRVAGRDDEAGAEALAEKLGGLPLAANQAAAFLKDRSEITFEEYAADLDRLLAEARDAGNQGEYPDTVFATLVKSLEALPTETQDLMCLLAWLSPDGVEAGLLIDAAEKKPEFVPDPLGAALRDNFDRADMVKEALRLSLLKTDADPEWGQKLILHRVVQAVLRVWQRAEGRAGWDARAAQIVNGVFPFDADDDPKTWPLCARLLPQARALAEHGPRQGDGGEALDRLLNQAGVFLISRGDTEGAIEMFEKDLEIARALEGENSIGFSTTLSNLAGQYTDAGRLDEAETGYRRVLEIKEKLLAPDDPSFAITLNNLGGVYWKRKDFARAEPLFQRARGVVQAAHGELSPDHATLTNSLAALYADWAEQPGQAARRAEARRLQDEALRIARAVRGERHPQVSDYLHNLAVLLARQGDLKGAAERELRAAAIMLSLGLAEHPYTQQRLSHLLHYWDRSGQGANKARLDDLLAPEIAAVEAAMQAWVAEDPDNRHFGPPPFAEHGGKTG